MIMALWEEPCRCVRSSNRRMTHFNELLVLLWGAHCFVQATIKFRIIKTTENCAEIDRNESVRRNEKQCGWGIHSLLPRPPPPNFEVIDVLLLSVFLSFSLCLSPSLIRSIRRWLHAHCSSSIHFMASVSHTNNSHTHAEVSVYGSLHVIIMQA